MILRPISLCFVLTWLLSACAPKTYTIIEKDQISQAFILNSSKTFKGYFYQGSDTNFHYFISKWDYKKDHYFKLYVNDLNILSPYPLDSTEVRIDLISSEKEFGHNESYKLYQFD